MSSCSCKGLKNIGGVYLCHTCGPYTGPYCECKKQKLLAEVKGKCLVCRKKVKEDKAFCDDCRARLDRLKQERK